MYINPIQPKLTTESTILYVKEIHFDFFNGVSSKFEAVNSTYPEETTEEHLAWEKQRSLFYPFLVYLFTAIFVFQKVWKTLL